MENQEKEMTPIVLFYMFGGRDNRGRTLEKIIHKSGFFLERSHDYIQWLFPLNERSQHNPKAPILTEEDISILRNSEIARWNMFRSLYMMLQFYNLKLIDDDQQPHIQKNWDANSYRFEHWWLTKNNHNYLRITRILKSLQLFGLDEYAIALFDCLKKIYQDTDKISDETFKYWEDAMEHTLLENKINGIFERYGYKPKEIHGTHFPEKFMMFHSWFRLAGSDLHFYVHDICQGNQEVDEREESLYNEFKHLLYRYEDELRLIWNEIAEKDMSEEEKKAEEDKKRKELANAYEEKFKAAYKAILEVELKHGLVRVVQVTERHDKEATVKSKYMDREVNYSPVLLSIPKFEEEDSISKHASLFANALTRPCPCGLIKIYLGKEIKKEEVSQIYKMMSEVADVFNAYRIEEYEEKKDSPEYQHRDDWNPADL